MQTLPLMCIHACICVYPYGVDSKGSGGCCKFVTLLVIGGAANIPEGSVGSRLAWSPTPHQTAPAHA